MAYRRFFLHDYGVYAACLLTLTGPGINKAKLFKMKHASSKYMETQVNSGYTENENDPENFNVKMIPKF